MIILRRLPASEGSEFNAILWRLTYPGQTAQGQALKPVKCYKNNTVVPFGVLLHECGIHGIYVCFHVMKSA